MRSLALIMICTPLLGFGQIAVSSSDFADGGDTVRMSSTTDFGVDFSTTGPNSVWDYSALVAESQTLLEFKDMSNASFLVSFIYGSFAPPSHQATYFMPSDDIPLDQLGGVLPVNITDIFQFTKVSANDITSIGFALNVEGTEVPFKSDTIEMRYEFPLMYQNTYNSRGYTNMDMNPVADIIWRQYRTRDSEVDGYGSITTPYGTFDALRVKHTITEIDSVYMDLFGGGFWIPLALPDSYIYEWITNGEKEAILRIETTSFGGNETVSAVEFRDSFVPALVGLDEEALAIEIFPNPVTDELKVVGIPPTSTYAIIDAVGAVVKNGELNVSESISVGNLSPGTYSIVIISDGKIVQSTFIKQ